MNKTTFKLIAMTLIVMLGLSLAPVNAFASTNSDINAIENKPTNTINNNINEFHEDAITNNISPFSDVIGGGGDNGSFTYFDNGAVAYTHGDCMKIVLYLPSSFIAKMERVGNTGVSILGLLGAVAANPIAAAAVAVIGLNWAKILWLDNGNGVSMIINYPTLAPPMESGCNYYMH